MSSSEKVPRKLDFDLLFNRFYGAARIKRIKRITLRRAAKPRDLRGARAFTASSFRFFLLHLRKRARQMLAPVNAVKRDFANDLRADASNLPANKGTRARI